MLATIEQRAKNNVREFRADIDQLEEYVKQWEQEFHLREIGKTSTRCYEALSDLQKSLTKLTDKAFHDKLQLDCYKYTRGFLSYFESEVNEDFGVLLLNNCRPFTRLFAYCSEYCSRIERDYGIPLDSEEVVRADSELFRRLQSLRGL